jgi:hypothetical protein
MLMLLWCSSHSSGEALAQPEGFPKQDLLLHLSPCHITLIALASKSADTRSAYNCFTVATEKTTETTETTETTVTTETETTESS